MHTVRAGNPKLLFLHFKILPNCCKGGKNANAPAVKDGKYGHSSCSFYFTRVMAVIFKKAGKLGGIRQLIRNRAGVHFTRREIITVTG